MEIDKTERDRINQLYEINDLKDKIHRLIMDKRAMRLEISDLKNEIEKLKGLKNEH